MRKKINYLYWTPRLLAILFTVFLYMFVLEVFAEGFNINNFLLSLIPGTIILLLTVLAWRKERLGGILFIILALLYLLIGFGRVSYTAITFMSGTSLFIGILFMLDDIHNKKLRKDIRKTKKSKPKKQIKKKTNHKKKSNQKKPSKKPTKNKR